MSTTNEKFYGDCAKFICGYINEIKISGDKKVVEYISDVLVKFRNAFFFNV